MVLLDTDHVSIMDMDSMAGFNLGRRLDRLSPGEIFISIVTYEEQMRGWLSYSANAKSLPDQVAAYRKLRSHVERYREANLLDFDEKAASTFEQLRTGRIRVGTMDLKIAAIAIANDATLLTRNLTDFERIPDLRVEDWSA